MGKPVQRSSAARGLPAGRAADGNLATYFKSKRTKNPWWAVNLQRNWVVSSGGLWAAGRGAPSTV